MVNKIDRPNTTPTYTVRGICTFAVYFSVFPFCRFTLVYEWHLDRAPEAEKWHTLHATQLIDLRAIQILWY